MTVGIQESPDRVLSTMESDGTRVWLRPRVSKGRYLNARRVTAYVLMVVFMAMPFGHLVVNALGGHAKQFMLLDIPARRFTILGYTFLPTDTILLALFMLIVFVAIFLFTALLGRLWCGWACPQTVYMEFLYRPLQRFFEGTAGKGGPARKNLGEWRKPALFLTTVLVSLIPAHTFLAYFVPAEQLIAWIRGNPFTHPTAFITMTLTTLLMLFDFGYFREQMCLIACPYGRFQSVLLDKWSMIVSYDRNRGEPRGRAVKGDRAEGKTIALPLVTAEGGTAAAEPKAGDCVDCKLCVTTCPTGIDIRDGLQMECVSCTQCIDACDAVMDKLQRPRGLIRYSSQAAMDGEKSRWLRPRVIFYPVILLVLIAIMSLVFANKGEADVTVLRNFGAPYMRLPEGRIGNALRLKIVNRTEHEATYRFEVTEPAKAVIMGEEKVTVSPGQSQTVGFVVSVPAKAFREGTCDTRLRVSTKDESGRLKVITDAGAVLLGPAGTGVHHD